MTPAIPREDKLREIVLVDVDNKLDAIGPTTEASKEEEWDVVVDLRKELETFPGRRNLVYGKAQEVAAQLIRLMMDVAR